MQSIVFHILGLVVSASIIRVIMWNGYLEDVATQKCCPEVLDDYKYCYKCIGGWDEPKASGCKV